MAIQVSLDTQSGIGCGVPNQIYNDLVTHQWFASPVFCNMTKHAMPGRTATISSTDILEMQLNKPINVCPSTEGGKNWQAMTYNQPAGLLIVSLSQSCMDFTAREVDFSGNGRGNPSGDVCTRVSDHLRRGREAVHRSDDRTRRWQPARCAGGDRPGLTAMN